MPTDRRIVASNSPTKPTRWPKLYLVVALCALSLPFLDGRQGRFLVGKNPAVIPVRDNNGYFLPMPVAPTVRSSIIWAPSSDGGGYLGGK